MANGTSLVPATADGFRTRFDPALFEFLMKLHRMGGAQKVGSIYGEYNLSLLRPSEVDDDFWYDELIAVLKGLHEIGGQPQLQPDGRKPPREFNLDANVAFYSKTTTSEEGVEEPDDLLDCVYWFGEDGAVSAQKRVYIHVAEPLAKCGIDVLKVLVPKLGRVAGFQKVKMFGPKTGRGRNDSIVAYCVDSASQKEIARTAAALSRTLFQPDVPRWVKCVAPGIGVADEPPSVEVFPGDTNQQSFGKFLSKLIWCAWEHNELGTDVEFLRLVLIAFETAKMNPLKPHKHSLRAGVESMQPRLDEALEKALSGSQ